MDDTARMSEPLRVDRERFLALVAFLGACNRVEAPVPLVTVEAPPPDAAAPPPLVVASATPVIATAEPPPVGDPCVHENESATVDCSRMPKLPIGPACEGVASLCASLADGSMYRPRAAAAAADCFARVGARVCDINQRKRCYDEGVHAACPEAKWDEPCATKLAECAARRITPRYTKEECMRAMSALAPGERDWALHAMGPSSEGKCQLMFTVY